MFGKCLDRVRETKPLVHAISNAVTASDCANTLLAAGALPIMANDPIEVAEVTAGSDALVLNAGLFNATVLEAMLIAGKRAETYGLPVVLDPVGVGVSEARTKGIRRLLQEIQIGVLRGNASEIGTLIEGCPGSGGVHARLQDRGPEDQLDAVIARIKPWAAEMGLIVAMTGAIDLVTDGKVVYIIHNGTPMLTKITGSGCMLSALTGAFLAANKDQPLPAVAAAVASMGYCGELAAERIQRDHTGNATFRNHVIDEIFKLTGMNLDAEAAYERLS